MIKKILTISFIVINILVQSQVTITVRDIDTKNPISKIVCSKNKKTIGETNAKGEVTLSATTSNIYLESNHYQTEIISTGFENQIIYLTPKVINQTIKTVVIKNKIDEYANQIVHRVIDRYEANHPNNLESFRQVVFSRIVFDQSRKDSLKMDSMYRQKKVDTELYNYLKDNVLFVWERVFEHKSDKRWGQKNIVLSSKMSGIKTPFYQIMAEMYSNNSYPRSIFKQWNPSYIYTFEDSNSFNGRKSFKISFFPLKKFKNNRTRSGYFIVDAATFSLVKYVGNSADGYAEINYKLINEKFYTNNAYIANIMGGITFSSDSGEATKMEMRMMTTTKEFSTPYTFLSSEFNGNIDEISRTFNDKKSMEMLENFENDSANSRIKNSFISMDSIAKKENLEPKLKLLFALRNGEVKVNKVNLDLNQLIQYNGYEGLRVGIGGHTNRDFDSRWQFGGYLGYGFGDKGWKYGLDVSYLANYQKNTILTAEWKSDVSPIGIYKMSYEPFRVNISDYLNSNFYQYQSAKLGCKTDIYRYLEGKFSLGYLTQKSLNGYNYNGNSLSQTYSYFRPEVDLHFYPKTRMMNTPDGKISIEEKPTHFYFNYQYGKSLNGTNTDFHRAELKVKSQIKTPLGRSRFTLKSGLAVGNYTLFNAFEQSGISPQNIHTFGIEDEEYFATMPTSTFFTDRYASLFYRFRVPLSLSVWFIHLQPTMYYGATLGDLSSPTLHSMPIQTPKGLYQETGLEMRKLILNLGLGFYYRVGAYNTGRFSDNWALRMLIDI